MTVENDTSCLCVQNITRRFGKTTALDELSFSISQGQIVGLLGRNGAGKSTLLRIVSGQLSANSGEISLLGTKVYGDAAVLGDLCMIGDAPDFSNLANAKELFYVCEGLFPAWNQALAIALAERFNLPIKRALKGFSRGMQTALLLVVGLCSGARLTVFDEPSLGLDAVMRERFYDLLLEMRKENPKRTFILSTHLIDEVARTLDYAVLIDQGRLLCEGSVAELTSLYMSVSGAASDVRAATLGTTVLKEEELAGSLVQHLRLNTIVDGARIREDERVQSASMSLQRLFVFLTEEKEMERHADNT